MSWRSCVPKKCSNQDINVLRFNVTEIVLPLGFADVIFRRERRPEILCGSQARSIKKLWLVPNLLTSRTCWWSPTVPSRKKFTVNPLLSAPPPLFRGGKLRSPPLPLSSILIRHKQLTWTDQLRFIQAGNSYCFWSSAAWPPTSCAELFQLYALVLCGQLLPFSYCSRKQHSTRVTTSPSSRNLAPVDEFR